MTLYSDLYMVTAGRDIFDVSVLLVVMIFLSFMKSVK